MENNNFKENYGHNINTNDLIREIYQLLAYSLASRPIAELVESKLYTDNDQIYQFEEIERDLLTNGLISIAIKIRILDDGEENIFNVFTDYCGTITKDILNPIETNGLNLREACNKIIHAEKVNFDVDSTTTGKSFVHPNIYLEGTEVKAKKKYIRWSVNIDIIKFCRESAAAVQLHNYWKKPHASACSSL